MNKIVLSLLAALITTAALAWFPHGTPLAFPTTVLWFYGTGALTPFLALPRQPGVGILQLGGAVSNSLRTTALGKGYQLMGGEGNLAPVYANGLDASLAPCPTCLSIIQNDITSQITTQGATWFYVDEPTVDVTNFTACCTVLSSVPFNVTGNNIIYNWIAGAYPSSGIRWNGNSGVLQNAASFDAGWKILLDNGFKTAFVEFESYEGTCCWSSTDPWPTVHAAYPGMLRSALIESIRTFCAEIDFNPAHNDMLSWWDVDNYGPWGYPVMDPLNLQIALDYAATGAKANYCARNHSEDAVDAYDPLYPGSATLTRTINDGGYVGWPTPSYTISSCDYRTFSGLNGVNGLVTLNGTDYLGSGMVQTNPSAPAWDTRTCNSTLTVTLGAGQECRDEVTAPITGYIAGTTLTVVTGNFGPVLTHSVTGVAGLLGVGVTAGTQITGASGGGPGPYTVNTSQTVGSSGAPVSMTAAYGRFTCLVEVRAHDNSPAGVGVPTYYQFALFF